MKAREENEASDGEWKAKLYADTSREGETEEPSRVGRWRQQQGPDELQSAVEEERIDEYKPQRNVVLTAIPRAGALQGGVPLTQRQPGAYSAQVVQALEANEVSDDELETEYQEAMAVPTVVKQRKAVKIESSGDHKAELNKLTQKNFHVSMERQSFLPGQSEEGQLGGWCQQVRRGSRHRQRCVRVWQFGERETLVSNESLSHDFELGNSTCVADVCFYEPNLDDSVVSDCDDTHSRTDDAIRASCTPVSALCVGNTGKRSFVRRYSIGNPSCLFAPAISCTKHWFRIHCGHAQ